MSTTIKRSSKLPENSLLETSLENPYFGAITKTVGELWTARQRQMHSLHYVISYRASFKPELPKFFIERFSEPGETVLDPFAGRGTTALQANLMGRIAISADINPLSKRIIRPKTNPVPAEAVERRLAEIDWRRPVPTGKDLSMFYHPKTARELRALRSHLTENRQPVDRFIELVALSRLHGHSSGFFSVYSFPQISVPPEAQRRINRRRRQRPDYRSVPELILRKAKRALRDGGIEAISALGRRSRVCIADSRKMNRIPDSSADLVVTSPPFLNKADYITDNWLEFWFCRIHPARFASQLFTTNSLKTWRRFIGDSMKETWRVLRPGRRAVIEVGDVVLKGARIHLDEVLVDVAAGLCRAGTRLVPERVYIQQQRFTKLANCFNVDNNVKGTNTNRMVVFVRE